MHLLGLRSGLPVMPLPRTLVQVYTGGLMEEPHESCPGHDSVDTASHATIVLPHKSCESSS